MKFEVYRGLNQWRWRLRARNGKIVATSGESYKRRADALKGVRAVVSAWPKTDVVVDGELFYVEQISKSGSLRGELPRKR